MAQQSNVLLFIKGTRSTYLLMFLLCIGLLGFGYYLEISKNLTPCPLCILQRLAFFAIAFMALVAVIHYPKKSGQQIYTGILTCFSIAGLSIASRQIWLQHLPADKVPECGPGLNYILTAFPLSQAIKMVLYGSGECAKIQWQFLSLSIPQWSLLAFIFLLAICGWTFFNKSSQ